MKKRTFRFSVLLWLGWYLWGPVDPAVDWWDPPREHMSDMVRAAGGKVALMGAGFALALVQSRRLRDRFRTSSRTASGFVASLAAPVIASHLSVPSPAIHSPPVPLRI